MSFKTTLKAAIVASEAVSVGVGLSFHSVANLWGMRDGEDEVMVMDLSGGQLAARDQQIEVDEHGCSIFEDVEGNKHAIQMSVMRGLTEADLLPEFQDEEVPDGATIH